jgi:hypothetical protein
MWQRAAAFFILKIRIFVWIKTMAHPGSGCAVFVLPDECGISPPHLTSPRVMLQSMGAPIAGRGTAKESGFDARASLTALPSWKACFQFPLPAHNLRGGLSGLCGERLGEGNCHHCHASRTHLLPGCPLLPSLPVLHTNYPDEPYFGAS